MHKVFPYILILLLFFAGYQCSRTEKLKTDLKAKENLVSVLSDSVRYTTNRLGQEVAQKRVLETTVKDLASHNAVLSANQRKLLEAVKTEKKGTVKAGVQIQEKVVLRDVQVLVNDTVVVIDSLDITNEKTIMLKEVKNGTEVTITNSNPVFQTANVDALLVPQKKSFWNSKFFKGVIFIAGFAGGVYLAR